jgi:hypothetical protein
MRKTVLALVSALALLLGACGQIQLPIPLPTAGTGPTVDSAATSDALFQTAVAQTLTAQPTLPAGPATETATPVASPVLSNTDTATAVPSTSDTPAAVPTSTPLVDQTSIAGSATSNFPTATSLPSNLLTATLAMGQVTASPTLGIRTYGTLPPAVPFSQVTLINRANAEAYISLQVTMPDGNYSIIEYPVEGRVRIQAPVGSYLYVAWVGGRKMVGEFRLHQNDDMSITLYRDRVVVR